jgi:hypothetical protein
VAIGEGDQAAAGLACLLSRSLAAAPEQVCIQGIVGIVSKQRGILDCGLGILVRPKECDARRHPEAAVLGIPALAEAGNLQRFIPGPVAK